MGRTPRWFLLSAALMLVSSSAPGAGHEYSAWTIGERPPRLWQNSLLLCDNLLTISEVADGDGASSFGHAQALTLVPRLTPYPGLRLSLRLSLLVNVTEPPGEPRVDHELLAGPALMLQRPRRPGVTSPGVLLSDLVLEADYGPAWLTIPRVGIRVIPGVKLLAPTSAASRQRSVVLGLVPGVALRARVPLSRGKALRWLGLTYAIRAYKYFHEHEVYPTVSCRGNLAGCLKSAERNLSWHVESAMEARLELVPTLHLTANLHYFTDTLYERVSSGRGGVTIHPSGSQALERSYFYLVAQLSHDPRDWLRLALGVTHRQDIGDDDSALPSATNLFLSGTLCLDRLLRKP